MKLSKILIDVARANIDALGGGYGVASNTIESLRAELDSAQLDLERHKQLAADYFRIVEEMQQERDQWRSMFHRASEEHCTAQAMMEHGVENAAVVCGRMLQILNQYRKKAHEKPWTMGDVFKSMPKTSASYKAKMLELVGAAKEPMDGVAERDKLGPAPKVDSTT